MAQYDGGSVVPERTTKRSNRVTRADRAEVLAAIKGARQRAGLTQEEAAARSGQHFTTISRWETGKAAPQSWEDLSAYAHSLGQAITLHFGPRSTEPTLAAKLDAIQRVVESNAKELAAALAILEAGAAPAPPSRDDPKDDPEPVQLDNTHGR